MCLLENCIKCKFHKVLDDPDRCDPFCDDDLAVMCVRSDKNPQFTELGNYIQKEPMVTVGCRPYRLKQESSVPDWCPLKLEMAAMKIEVYHRGQPDIYDVYEMVESVDGVDNPKHLFSRGAPDNVLTLLAELSEKRPIRVKFIDQTAPKALIGGQWPEGYRSPVTGEPRPI